MSVAATNYDERFDRIDNQIQSIHDEFNAQLDKLTTVVIKGFDRLDNELDKKSTKEDIERLYNLMDKIAKQQEIDDVNV